MKKAMKENDVPLVEIEEVLRKYLASFPVDSFGVFGSYARGEQNESSDIDVLLRFNQPVDLFTFARMNRELSTLFDRKVDLVTENSLHPAFRENIFHDLKVVKVVHEKRPALP